MKKHTKGVRNALGDLIVTTLYRGRRNYEKVIADDERLKGIMMTDREAFQLMGLLNGYDIVSPRQLSALKEEWLHPSYVELRERTMWSLFGATMRCLKTCPPMTIMEKHVEAYRFLVEYGIADR